MRFKNSIILFFLSLAAACSISCQNAAAKSDFAQARTVDNDIGGERASDFQLGMVYSNYPAQDIEWLKSQGWRDEQIKDSVFMMTLNVSSNDWHQVTNLYRTAHFDIYQIGSSNIFVPASSENDSASVVLTRIARF